MNTVTRKLVSIFLSLLLHCLFVSLYCVGGDIISSSQPMKDSQTITSKSEIFELGFFSPPNSGNRYVGLWYKNIPDLKIVWVANRENPLMDTSGVPKISGDGNLVLLDVKGNLVWSTNVSFSPNSSVAVLLDTGNLVLRRNDSRDNSYLWESFDYPSDTLLPNMKLWFDTETGEKCTITSWKSDSDPSPGSFSVGMVDAEKPRTFIFNGSLRYWRSGVWNGSRFIGVLDMNSSYSDGVQYTLESPWGVLTFATPDPAIIRLDSAGTLRRMNWYEGRWAEEWKVPRSQLYVYDYCGQFGVFNNFSSPICNCLKGFEPKYTEQWRKGNWSGGCIRRSELECERNNNSLHRVVGGRFSPLKAMKLPDYANRLNDNSAKDCENKCLENCTCVAYAFVNVIGCLVWSGELNDVQKFAYGGEELFLRLARSEFDKHINLKVIIIVTLLVTLSSMGACIYISWRWMEKQRGNGNRKRKRNIEAAEDGLIDDITEYTESKELSDNPELQVFKFKTVEFATKNFHLMHKLGQGGFGFTSYLQGVLSDGKEIAVKRLSQSSCQGLEEFKNEVIVISKLQHRNLVRLLGCCIGRGEKMLVYEYMPNKSLDSFLFDSTKKTILDWRKRFQIIEGIGRGLIYLHRDSRLKVIHRDLKASNILLDEELNPRISDFGMARIFRGDQIQANTRRVVGTYGYMSPEYAMEGVFSEKSDVFSFGVLLLEIVSGKRNSYFVHQGESWSLLGRAWNIWVEGNVAMLIDPTLSESYAEEIQRCTQIALLCVQDLAKDRPNMSSIISMLTSESICLPTPNKPAFAGRTIANDSELSQDSYNASSTEDGSITLSEGR